MKICVKAVRLRAQRILSDPAGVQEKIGVEGVQMNLIRGEREALRLADRTARLQGKQGE